MAALVFICPVCHGPLERSPDAFRCTSCGSVYPLEQGIADFSGGHYYDSFQPGDELCDTHAAGLENEIAGAEARARFYAKLIPRGGRVLDCGAGNGLTVEYLRAAGFDAWGNDNSALRKWQWRERPAREHLVVAGGECLPFSDGFFEAIVCSGVLEHIGVDESALPSYRVTPRPDRDEQRIAFVRELLRVLAPDGVLYLDFPNGASPIDFWHGPPRWHGPHEGFLPAIPYLRRLLGPLGVSLSALSPYGRLQFRQVSAHWYGRLFSPLMRAFFAAMTLPLVRRLAASPLNPFLVVKVVRSGPALLRK